jgi:predicted membrane-bound spermidine synthase
MAEKAAIETDNGTTSGQLPFRRNILLLVAFIEGGAVMAIELAGAKMVAPFYGTSLYVWASVLAVTLSGLTTGYFLGGWATYRYPAMKVLIGVLLAGTVLICIMPLLASTIMPATNGLGLRMGSLVSCTLFMFLPLICMGMVSPAIIHLSNQELKGTGRTAGTIYAISTVGGIIMTLLMGFFLLPDWGIRNSVYLTAVLLGSMAVMLVILCRTFRFWATGGALAIVFSLLAAGTPFTGPEVSGKYIYRSEGMLGQIAVFQFAESGSGDIVRLLTVNQITQTYLGMTDPPVSHMNYTHRIATLAGLKPAGAKALLIGMGGGSIATELKNMGFQLDIVELDSRMFKVAEDYFAFDPRGVREFVDDGRHFIRCATDKYDIVVIDVCNGEIQPNHMFTQESCRELKKILSPDGVVLINFPEYIYGERGRGGRSLIKTLADGGFICRFFSEGEQENSAGIYIAASPVELDYTSLDAGRLNACCKSFPPFYKELKTDKDIDLTDALVLSDDRPIFEKLNNKSIEEWRQVVIDTVLAEQVKCKVPFFR